MHYYHRASKAADIGIHIVAAHSIAECLAIAHHAAHTRAAGAETAILVHQRYKVRDIKRRIEQYQPGKLSQRVFSRQGSHQASLT